MSAGADADITVVDPDTGTAVLGMVAGNPIMRNGQVLGQGGTLLVTPAGEAAAQASGLPYHLVDLTQTKLYANWSSVESR